MTLTVTSAKSTDVLVDYHELHDGLAKILAVYDHRHLNEVMMCATTCENLAHEIMDVALQRWPIVSRVEVQEQSATGCVVEARK